MMRPDMKAISRDQMREALLRSGYLLESRVESVLREQWGYVETNVSYPDPKTNKSRELDVYAMSAVSAGPDEYDFLFGVLLAECVNNPQPVVMLTKEPLIPSIHHHDIKMAGLPVKIPSKERSSEWLSLADFLGMEKYHHYCRGLVATQFCSFLKKRGANDEWMATHDESHFEAFSKLCDATDYFLDRHFKSWSPAEKEWVNVEVYYPLVIVQGDLLEARPTKRDVSLKKAQHIQFRRSVIRNAEQRDYRIDVVQEQYLGEYLDILDEEISKTARLLKRRKQIVRSAVDRIARKIVRLRSPEKIRRELEF